MNISFSFYLKLAVELALKKNKPDLWSFEAEHWLSSLLNGNSIWVFSFCRSLLYSKNLLFIFTYSIIRTLWFTILFMILFHACSVPTWQHHTLRQSVLPFNIFSGLLLKHTFFTPNLGKHSSVVQFSGFAVYEPLFFYYFFFLSYISERSFCGYLF